MFVEWMNERNWISKVPFHMKLFYEPTKNANDIPEHMQSNFVLSPSKKSSTTLNKDKY